MKIAVSIAVVVLPLVAPVAAQEPERIGTMWVPAAEVLNPDGTLTPEFASPRELPRGDVTAQDDMRALGGRVVKWQRQFWDQFGRASAHGLQDGAVMLDDLVRYCIGDMKSVWALTERLFEIPERFGEWADGAEAILVFEVSRIAPGFNRYGEPEILVTVKLLRHLFDPARPFPTEMRFTLPIGEFVAGDTVFCRRATWAGYRPNVGDRLLIGAFTPSSAEYRLIGLDKMQPDSHVFVVAQDGNVRHLVQPVPRHCSLEGRRLLAPLVASSPTDNVAGSRRPTVIPASSATLERFSAGFLRRTSPLRNAARERSRSTSRTPIHARDNPATLRGHEQRMERRHNPPERGRGVVRFDRYRPTAMARPGSEPRSGQEAA